LRTFGANSFFWRFNDVFGAYASFSGGGGDETIDAGVRNVEND